MKKVSIVVFLVGLVLTIFTTVTYFTKEKVVDLGNIEISRDKPHSFNWSPIVGVAIMGIGGILFWQTYNEQ
jgi:hypothetical protein